MIVASSSAFGAAVSLVGSVAFLAAGAAVWAEAWVMRPNATKRRRDRVIMGIN
jgi:hypothetical protein